MYKIFLRMVILTMKHLSRVLKVAGVAAGIICVFASLSFVKVLMNDRNANTDGNVHNNFVAASRGNYDSNDAEASSYEVTKTEVEENTDGVKKYDEKNDAINKDDVKGEKSREEVKKFEELNNNFYNKEMTDFCQQRLEPMGFTLSTDEYFANGNENAILLRFKTQKEMSIEDKKVAAICISKFIYSTFEENTGFKTGYLKVHLRLPEGDSFALSRQDYQKWFESGENDDVLFDKFIGNTFYEQIEVVKPIVDQLFFDAGKLQQHLNEVMNDGITYKVEGNNTESPGIYIYMDKEIKEFSTEQLDDIIVKVSAEVFRNFYNVTGQKVGAYKFMDKNSNVFFVIYREDIDKMWPEGGSDNKLREYIRTELNRNVNM